MALDLEEQEQLAELKAWWQQYGSLVVALVVGVALALAGWQGWRWYERSQSAQAAVLYEGVARAAQGGDAKAVRDGSGALLENYPRSTYASMGALVAARFHFERNDLKGAKAQLQWVVANGVSEDFRDIARLRLAATLLDEKAYDEALRLLDEKHAAAYDAQYAAARGDVLVAKNDAARAKDAYRAALEKAGAGSSAFRESVRMRLEALGG
jgi:predicted negative regulator of RcsB-dependent stress response